MKYKVMIFFTVVFFLSVKLDAEPQQKISAQIKSVFVSNTSEMYVIAQVAFLNTTHEKCRISEYVITWTGGTVSQLTDFEIMGGSNVLRRIRITPSAGDLYSLVANKAAKAEVTKFHCGDGTFAVLSKSKKTPHPVVPTDLNYALKFIQELNDIDVIVQSVRHSKWNGFFQSTHKAVWVETNFGIVEIVFFSSSADTQKIQITSVNSELPHRYQYNIQENPGAAVKLVDANRPLYFTIKKNMLMVAESPNLNKQIKLIY